jgi:hypothetical protein
VPKAASHHHRKPPGGLSAAVRSVRREKPNGAGSQGSYPASLHGWTMKSPDFVSPNSEQEVFDLAVTHLRTQGRRSIVTALSGRDHCAYRGSDGLKCAIGVMIPDELYSPDMEGASLALSLIVDTLPPAVQKMSMEYLHALQMCHDAPRAWRPRGGFSAHGEKLLRRVAHRYQLVYTPPPASS